MTVMAQPVNHKEVENNISCVDLSVANVLCWPLFMVTGRRGGKNLRVFKFSVQETRLEKSVGFQTDSVPSSSLLRDYN